MSKSYLGQSFFKVNNISELKILHRPKEFHLLALVLITSAEFAESFWRVIVCHDFSQQIFTKLKKLLVVS